MPNDVCNTYQGLHTIVSPRISSAYGTPPTGTALTLPLPRLATLANPANDNVVIVGRAGYARSIACRSVSIPAQFLPRRRSFPIKRYQIFAASNDQEEFRQAFGIPPLFGPAADARATPRPVSK